MTGATDEVAAPSEPPAPSGASGAPRAGRRRGLGPAAMWMVAALAVVNAVVWAFITPVFQTPDEPVHVGYAQYFAETGSLPTAGQSIYAPSPDADTTFRRLPWSTTGRPSWSVLNDRELKRELSRNLPRTADAGAGYLSTNPPLYYALEAVPYRLALSGNFLDRVFAMRLLSALLAGLTAAFTFLFVRELMPRTPWAWTLGGLAVAFQPMFGFISGGVNNDALLWTCGAALFWLVARAFRRGLTPVVGAGIGAAFLAGAMTKTSMFGVLPGLLVGLALMLKGTRGPARRRTLIGAAVGAAVAGIPFAFWLYATSHLLNRTGSTAAGFGSSPPQSSLRGELSYLWQFYLPKLPFETSWFTGTVSYPLWQSYFQAFVGRFGWFAFGFPLWVCWAALGVAVTVIAGAARTIAARGLLRGRRAELACYAGMAAGLFLLVNLAGYHYKLTANQYFEQIRYVFPVLALYGALVAVGAKGAGPRWGPVVAAVFVMLAIANSVFAQLITIAHYYA